MRNNETIDWTLRENVRARMRVMVKRILHSNGCKELRQLRPGPDIIPGEPTAELRDTLLPKLTSGQMHVLAVKELVEAEK